MNYSYELERVSKRQNFVRVRFSRPGYDDFRKTLNPPDPAFETLETLHAFVKSHVIYAKGFWDRQEMPEVPEEDYNVGVKMDAEFIEEVAELPAEDVLSAEVSIFTARRNKEAEGVFVNIDDVPYFIETSTEGVLKLLAAQLGAKDATFRLQPVEAGVKQKAKAKKLKKADVASVFVELVNHYEKCAMAEGNALAKLEAGDASASFLTEWEALQ